MGKRKQPFGYKMKLGEIVPQPQEAEAVRSIYLQYLAGASFKQLAEQLQTEDVPYDEDKSWNKNMVARILEDDRYIGEKEFPALIPTEQFHAAQERRKEMRPEYKQTPAQKELRKLCGGIVPDSVARKVLKILNQVVNDPQLIKIETSGVPTTEDIRRLQQELNTLLQTPPVDADTARQKALEVASLKLASVKTEEYESHCLRNIFETHPKMDALDAALLKQSLRKIECHGDTVCYLLKNGKKPCAAKWYGKVSTTLFYIAIGLIVVMDGFMKVSESTFNIASTTALVITAGFMVYTFIRYFGVFREILRSTDGKYDLNLPEEMRAKKERTPKN